LASRAVQYSDLYVLESSGMRKMLMLLMVVVVIVVVVTGT